MKEPLLFDDGQGFVSLIGEDIIAIRLVGETEIAYRRARLDYEYFAMYPTRELRDAAHRSAEELLQLYVYCIRKP